MAATALGTQHSYCPSARTATEDGCGVDSGWHGRGGWATDPEPARRRQRGPRSPKGSEPKDPLVLALTTLYPAGTEIETLGSGMASSFCKLSSSLGDKPVMVYTGSRATCILENRKTLLFLSTSVISQFSSVRGKQTNYPSRRTDYKVPCVSGRWNLVRAGEKNLLGLMEG